MDSDKSIKLVLTLLNLEKQIKEINVSGFESGVYIVEATAGDKIMRQKFIVERDVR